TLPDGLSSTTIALRDALLEDPRVMAVDPHVGGRFMAQALAGFTMRQHFDERHPEQIDDGLRAAPTEARDREAWLVGYRFPDTLARRQQEAGASSPVGTICRVCGCTDGDCRQCIEKTGAPCW